MSIKASKHSHSTAQLQLHCFRAKMGPWADLLLCCRIWVLQKSVFLWYSWLGVTELTRLHRPWNQSIWMALTSTIASVLSLLPALASDIHYVAWSIDCTRLFGSIDIFDCSTLTLICWMCLTIPSVDLQLIFIIMLRVAITNILQIGKYLNIYIGKLEFLWLDFIYFFFFFTSRIL